MLLRTMRKEEERRVVEHTPSGTCSSLDNVEKGLYEKISERYSSAHAAFRAFAEGSVLGIDNVKSMVDRVVCVRIDREILATLVRRMGDGGPIRYHAFRKYINMLENKFNGGQPKPIEPTERALPPRQQYHNPEQNLSRTVHNVNKIQDMILEKMKQRYRSPSQAFLKFDHQRCGFISIQEFRMVLEQSGIHLSDENFRTISRRFDRDGNNRISYHEFVRQMSTPPASHEKRKHAEDQARNMQLAQAREKSLEYRNELKRMIENKKQRQREEKERIRRLEEKEEREAANYNPWGRGGCGAPLRDSAGNVLANFQTRGKASTEPMSRPAPAARVYQQQQQQQQQYNQQRQRRNNNNNDEATSSKHARFRFEDLPSYEREAIQTKNQKQLQWQRDLALQVERKKRMKEQEAARKREEEIKERARLERQRIELQRENEERIILEKLKKESEDNTPQSSRQVSMPRQVVSTPRQDPPPTITTTTSTTERKRITTESTPQLHRHHEEETFESSSPSKITNDAMFLKELEMRHEDALERQQRAFDVSMSPSRQQSYSSSPIRDHHQQQQIESTSSIVYMANSSSSGGDGDHHRQTLLSPSFTNSNKSKSEILMDFLKRRNMWS
ncbi:EF-hand domain-containing protein [bacterium]|nr:EF-hand domain-containing protein [bacterium]